MSQGMKNAANVGFIELNQSNVCYNAVQMCMHLIISNLVEMGIVKDHELQHCNFDISEMMYIIDKPHITVLASKKNNGQRTPIDMDPILRKYGDFKFGFCEFEQIQLSKMDSDYTPIIKIPM